MMQPPGRKFDFSGDHPEGFDELRGQLEDEMDLLQGYYAGLDRELTEEEDDFIFELKELHSNLYDYKPGSIEKVPALIQKSKVIRQKHL
jgi:hypothetical protein